MDIKHGNPQEPGSPGGSNASGTAVATARRRSLIGVMAYFVAPMIIVAVVVVLGLCWCRRAETHVGRLADRLAGADTVTSDQAVIPLEILFPAGVGAGRPSDRAGMAAGRAVEEEASTGLRAPSPEIPVPAKGSEVTAETGEVAKELADRFPRDPDALEVAARMCVWLGDSDQAARIWETCLTLNPDYGYAHEGLGTLASKRGNPSEAISRYRKALEAFAESPVALGTRIRLATVLIDQGQLDEAIELLKRDAQSTPPATEVLVLLGMAHLQSKSYAEARRYYEAAIAGHPMHANAHFGLATCCTRLGDTEAAANYMKRFQELRAGERDIRIDQRSHYDDVEEMRVELAQMHSNAGRIYHAHGDLTGAERHWRRAALLDPRAVECRQAVAWFCQQGGRTRDAVVLLRQLAEIEPNIPAYLLEVGRLEMELGDYDEAEKAFQTLLQKMPSCADAYASLARLYLRSGRYPERVAGLADSAARLEPTVENLLLLAVASERSGNVSGAAAAMERVTTLAPNRADYQQIHQELRNRLAAKNAP
ncbi:MAG: tetratricopeptide repeat protein [Thermoguttaceae bacterium]